MENTPGLTSLLVVKSVHHGNTAKVARVIAGVLGAEVSSPEETPYSLLAACGLVGFGSGVYYGQLHPALFEWLRSLPDVPKPTRPAFIFSTSGLPFLAKLWHWPLRRVLSRKGFYTVGEFTCRGFDTRGPLWLAGGLNKQHPDERDLQRAREFAGKLAGSGRLFKSVLSRYCPCLVPAEAAIWLRRFGRKTSGIECQRDDCLTCLAVPQDNTSYRGTAP